MSKWIPIETAPRDGTYILVAGGKDDLGRKLERPHIATSGFRYSPSGIEEKVWLIETLDREDKWIIAHPTHWVPLPEPPKETEE